MLSKPLREEQADMRSRWSDPAYQWANDSNLRRKLDARRHVAVPQRGSPNWTQRGAATAQRQHES